jgi:hypothetical protein
MRVGRRLVRLARLGFFVGLGAVSALIEACGGSGSAVRPDARAQVPDAAPADAGTPDAAPTDGAGWDVPLE